MTRELSGSEALFGFMGWLTSRPDVVTLSSNHDAGIAADLIKEFAEANDLSDPRELWDKLLVQPRTYALDPCPFCGSQAELYDDADIFGADSGMDYWVSCDSCQGNVMPFETRGEAVDAWNNRSVSTTSVSLTSEDSDHVPDLFNLGA